MKFFKSITTALLTIGLTFVGLTAGNATTDPPAKGLVAVDSSGTMWRYATPGNTTIGARTKISTGWKDATQVVSADWNNDNIMDVVARWTNGALTLHAGKPDGTFGPRVAIGNGWQNYDITVSQFKMHENFPGIVAREVSGGRLFYYPNTTGATLKSGRILVGGGGWSPMTELNAVDWDKDGAMDVVARNGKGELRLYRSNGKAAFINESRKLVGNGWNGMSSISAEPNFAGRGTTVLMARTSAGALRYYPIVNGTVRSPKTIGAGWSGYKISAGSVPPAKLASSGPEYAARVVNYVKPWCPKVNVILDHSSVVSGNVYGMMWWNSTYLAIRSGIPESITKSIALHECGHMLQAKAYVNKHMAVSRMAQIYGGAGTEGLERGADCIAAYLNPYSNPAAVGASGESAHWAMNCTGYKGEAAKKIIRGIRP